MPDDPIHHSDYLHLLHYDPDNTPEVLFQAAHRWGEQQAQALYSGEPRHDNNTNPNRVLRVGYVSGDFRDHPVSRFITPVLQHHDRSAVVIYCYSHASKPDAVTDRLRPLACAWRQTQGLDSGALADLIRQDKIDVLIDLSGHLGQHRLLTFARMPAPVQVSYLGYFATTGVKTIGYRLTDAWHDPPGMTDRYYTERLTRLDRCCWCYEPRPDAPEVNKLPALTAGYVTFASLNRLVKVNDHVIRAYGRVMNLVPGSKLLLLVDPGSVTDAELARRFAAGGIDPSRMILAPRRAPRKYLELFHQADILLDTFPYAGMTTTCDGLWMGVPTVTLAGQTHVSRVGVSLMNAVGLPQMVAATEDEYVEAAVKLATDLPRLAELRRGLRDRMRASPLMDGEGLTRRIEAAYRDMWRTWCATAPGDKLLAPAPLTPTGDGRAATTDARPVEPPSRPLMETRPEAHPLDALVLQPLRDFFSHTPTGHAAPTHGVVSAADAAFFEGLQLLLWSLNGRVPVAVFDLGLTPQQVDWCRSMPQVRVVSCPPLLVPESRADWKLWNKPAYLLASPFETTVWVDADAFVVGDLAPLFRSAAEGFWVVKHGLRYSRANDPRLYEHRPVRHRFPPGFHLNAGVVGFPRGDPVVPLWAAKVAEFTADRQVGRWVSYHDEGVLHWVVESLGCHERVVNLPPWNRLFYDLSGRYPTAESFVRTFDRADNVIVHASGPKIWTRWNPRSHHKSETCSEGQPAPSQPSAGVQDEAIGA